MRLFVWIADGWTTLRTVVKRHHRLLWILLATLAVGIGLGIWLGSKSAREYTSLWAQVVLGTWKPFATFGRALLIGGAGLAVYYLATRFRTRWPYFGFLLFFGYLWGRVSAMSALSGGEGGISVVVIIPIFLIILAPSLWLVLTTLDRVVYSLRPSCNRAILRSMLWAMVALALCAFVYIILVLGIVNASINLV